jgi:DNA repair protein RadC
MEPERIKELPADERPRERLLRAGPRALSDAELLAIFIRTGTPGRNAVQVGRELLQRFGGMSQLARKNAREFSAAVKGIGRAKACELEALFEIGRRLAHGATGRPKLDTPQAIFEFLAPDLQCERQEVLVALLLDTRYQLILAEKITKGSVNESLAPPREIFRPAVVHSAYAVIIAHNHPSGDPTPSEADRRITRQLSQAADCLGIRLLDHVIIGNSEGGRQPYTSFRELGLI